MRISPALTFAAMLPVAAILRYGALYPSAARPASAAPAVAGPHSGTLDPCKLVGDGDVFRLLGWSVDSREKRPYALAGANGTICFIGSPQGQVVVTVPDRGANFPGVTPYNDPGAASLARHVYGLGGDVQLYNGTAFVTRYKRSISVHVVPNQEAASYDDVEGFASVAIKHMR